MGLFVERALECAANGARALEATDSEWMAKLPAIFDFLSCCVGLNGKPRQTASLTLFARSGSWHMCLKDRSTKQTWWDEGDTIQAALEALERQLTA